MAKFDCRKKYGSKKPRKIGWLDSTLLSNFADPASSTLVLRNSHMKIVTEWGRYEIAIGSYWIYSPWSLLLVVFIKGFYLMPLKPFAPRQAN